MKNIDKHLIEYLKSLPVGYWDFKNEDTKEMTHGIHKYPAVMIYPIPRNLINFIKRYQNVRTLLDPFMGSGTVLVEGIFANLEVHGTDLNPLARLISRVRTRRLDYRELDLQVDLFITAINQYYRRYETLITSVNDYIKQRGLDVTSKEGWGEDAPKYLKEFLDLNGSNIEIHTFKNIGYWFLPSVILELQIIKDCIDKIENNHIKEFFLVAFSETVRLTSNTRNGEFKLFRMEEEKIKKFCPNVREQFFKVLNNNISKMKTYIKFLENNNIEPRVHIMQNDTRESIDIPDESIDLMITSPPYGDSKTTVAYGQFSRLSLQWLNLEDIEQKEINKIDKKLLGGIKADKDFEYELDSDTLKKSIDIIRSKDLNRARDVYSFYCDLDKSIRTITRKMRVNSYQFWIVGNRTVKGEKLFTDRIIIELGRKYNLKFVYNIGRNIPNKVMPLLNSPTNRVGEKISTMTNEHIVVLRKER